MIDWFRPKAVTRRHVLLACAVFAALLPLPIRPAAARALDEEFIIVNGWVLKREDLQPR
jgi:hypothetical protein